MDYKFDIEETYIIDWEKTKDIDALSIGTVVCRSPHYITITSCWLFPGGPEHVQVIPKRKITNVYPLGHAKEDNKVVKKKYLSIKCDTEGEKYFYVRSGHGC